MAFGQAAAAPAAQTAPAAAKEFDVASVRPSPPLDMQKLAADVQAGKMPNFGVHINGLRAEYNYTALKTLIASAYNVKEFQVTGPDWLASEHFDIVATMPVGSTKDDAPVMLQALLADRFKLVIHRDTQEHPVMALVVAKGGPKMKESPGDAEPLDADAPLKPGEMKMDTPDGPARITIDAKGGGATMNMGKRGIITYSMDPQTQMMQIRSSKTTMSALADMLTQIGQAGGGRQVVDMTGLTGNYEVSLEFSLMDMIAVARAQGLVPAGGPGGGGPGGPGAGPATTQAAGATAGQASDPGEAGASLFKSVDALGLKLEQRKAPVEQIIVDSVQKTPTEN